MPQIVLFAGVLLLVYGLASLAAGPAPSSLPRRPQPRLAGVVIAGLGAALVVGGLVLLRSA